MSVERDRANGAGFMSEVMLGGVGIFEAAAPGGALAINDEIFGSAERNSIFGGKLFCAGADEHHVLAFFEHAAGQADGVADPFDGGNRAGFQRSAVHHDGVELDAAVTIQVRADACVERGIVFEGDDGGFDGVNRWAACAENFPAGLKGATDSVAAIFDCFVGNVPGAAVDDEGRLQGFRDAIYAASTIH